MVCVTRVCVYVRESIVPVWVTVRFSRIDARRVFMLMVFIMLVTVVVFERLMGVHMIVPIGDEQRHAEPHHACSGNVDRVPRVAE
jgi:hypothetical protein